MNRVLTQVYETDDYSMFKHAAWNRPVTDSRKDIIKKSISQVGMRINPIVINEQGEVIDGQGRLAALIDLGLPVPYVYDVNAGAKECQCMMSMPARKNASV